MRSRSINASQYLLVDFMYEKLFLYLDIGLAVAILGCFLLVISIAVRHQRHIRAEIIKGGQIHHITRRNSKATITVFLMGLSMIVANLPWMTSCFIAENIYLRYFLSKPKIWHCKYST